MRKIRVTVAVIALAALSIGAPAAAQAAPHVAKLDRAVGWTG